MSSRTCSLIPRSLLNHTNLFYKLYTVYNAIVTSCSGAEGCGQAPVAGRLVPIGLYDMHALKDLLLGWVEKSLLESVWHTPRRVNVQYSSNSI